MRGTLGALALLVGCTEPGALVIVNVPAGATHVELFVSQGSCEECSSLTPPSLQGLSDQPLYGDGWIVFDLERFHVDLEGATTARFFLKNDTGTEIKLQRVLAVALSGTLEQETVVGAATVGPLHVPDGEVELVIDLAAADALGSMSSNEHVELWRRPNDASTYSACAIVQHPDGHTEFFVPDLDRDCDDFMPRPDRLEECTDYGNSRPPTIEEARCVTRLDPVTPHCRIGGSMCTDSVTTEMACVPVEHHHCLSDRVCGALANASGTCAVTPFTSACIATAISLTTMPIASCELLIDDVTHAPCNGTGTGTGRLVAGPIVNDLGGACSDLEIATMAKPLTFGSTAEVGRDSDPSGAVELATLTLAEDTFDGATCSIGISWTGLRYYSDFALLRVKTTTGVLRVVPLKIHATPAYDACPTGDTVTCDAIGMEIGDSLRTCE